MVIQQKTQLRATLKVGDSEVYSSPVPDMLTLRNRTFAGCEAIRNTPGLWVRLPRGMGSRCEAYTHVGGGHFDYLIYGDVSIWSVRRRSAVREALGSNPRQGIDVGLSERHLEHPLLYILMCYIVCVWMGVELYSAQHACIQSLASSPAAFPRGVVNTKMAGGEPSGQLHRPPVSYMWKPEFVSESGSRMRAEGSCIQVELMQGFEKCSLDREQPLAARARRPAASSSTTPTCESPGTPPRIETRLPRWEVNYSFPRDNWVRFPAGSLPYYRMKESCWTMALAGGFPRGSPVSHALSFRRCSILTSNAVIGSQDLDLKSRLNISTPLPTNMTLY
ncbi:hypothetical protein PR048_031792 [Dryococelus australis]|uniref:Uncharacterized protein n=1 Tax=Dryococelus australis TaxID=614101 RepID=A0ABQ9G698_9NEOP|nr:hypothetical protein PR048_031792 [Dryococelus australis]